MIHISEVRTIDSLPVDNADPRDFVQTLRSSGCVRDQRWVFADPISLSQGDSVTIDQESSEVVVCRRDGGTDRFPASVRPAGILDELLTLEQVMELFGFKESYVRWLRKKGGIPCGKIHGQLRFVRSHLEEWAWSHLAQDPSMGDTNGD